MLNGPERLLSLRGRSSVGRRSSVDRPSLLDRRRPFFTGVDRFGINKWSTYLGDPFHTLLNLPWWKFIIIFFSTYVIMFCTFAVIYLAFPRNCVVGVNGSFAHALWMSSRTASTIGFNQIYPEVTCAGPNLVVMLQVIASSLINFIMLGLVFARFSAPFKRANSVQFSSICTLSRHPSGHFALTFRVANIRKHQLLKPEIKVLLTAIDSITPSNYVFEHLAVEAKDMQQMNMELGFPAHVVHLIKPGSPLYNLSLQEMDARMMEVIVFIDGIDAMTSKAMQARRNYYPHEMVLNEQFIDLHLEMRGGKLGLDFGQFDATTSSTDTLLSEYTASDLKGMSMPDIQLSMQQMRHHTFRRLAEKGGRPTSSSGGGGGAGSSGAAGQGQQQQQQLGRLPLPAAAAMQGQPPQQGAGAAGAGANGGFVSVELGNLSGI